MASETSETWPDIEIEIDQISAQAETFQGRTLFLAGSCNNWIGEDLQRAHLLHFQDAQL